MRAVVIAGPKKSGKTMLLALTAEALERRGKRVAVVKHSAHALEKGNADAFWLMRPGRVVVSVGPEETAIFWPETLDFAAIVRHIAADVLLLEGGDAPPFVPRILCFREGMEEDQAVMCANPPFAILATHGIETPSLCAPHFPEIDPQAAEKLANLIMERGAEV